MTDPALLAQLNRLADALDRLAPPPPAPADLDAADAADAYVWHADGERLEPVARVAGIALTLLHGIAAQRDTLLANTRRFAAGLPANNALLWGARGMGKSSLVKAVHAAVLAERAAAGDRGPALIEINREDLATLGRLLARLRMVRRRVVLYCDDLSFDQSDAGYKSLKAVLEGGIEGRPETVLFYAPSNRRHLMPREMIDNERSTAIIAGEAVEEKVSLSDRFGLWLGFHPCNQDGYLAMVRGYVEHFALPVAEADWQPAAAEWAITRGSRSGRVAWQFVQDLAGRLERPLPPT